MLKKIVITVLVFLSVGCLGYPKIATWYNRMMVEKEVSSYKKDEASFNQAYIDEQFQLAEKYNEDLRHGKKDDNYSEILNTNNDGLIGYVTVPSISLQLPVYHGTSDNVLTKGAGHMMSSSFPIGGKGTHAVLSSHCGMPNHVGFTNLEKVKEGDQFSVTVLNKTLVYEVEQIKIVEPTDTSEVRIDSENDYVTLLTCYPYGINSHRLLVRGKRVETVSNIDSEMMVSRTFAETINDIPAYEKVIGIAVVFVLLATFCILHRK